jgi:hypothetical protein
MPVSGHELATLDFANLIGGPLNAVVQAQAKAAITTANFINEVGFKKKDGSDDKEPVNMTFKYSRRNDNGNNQNFELTVPLITMLPIPYITVNEAEIEFNAKITSVNESTVVDKVDHETEISAGRDWWFVSASLQSKTSYQRNSVTTGKEERTFDMHVRVRAKNQDMPAGTERLLTILEGSISENSLKK